MRILGIHTRQFHIDARERALEGADPISDTNITVDHPCIVLFIAVEQSDEQRPESCVRQLVEDTHRRAEQLDAQTVVVYPYVHLTEHPAAMRLAQKTIETVANQLEETLDTVRAPFGWYKAFDLSCLGHPLAEWSARYVPQETEESPSEERQGSEFIRFVAVDLEGNTYEIEPETYASNPIFKATHPTCALIKRFIDNELGRSEPSGRAPRHIAYMQRHELVDYCDVSEKGHYKWYPKGVFMQRLILDYAARLAADWGAVEMKNPLVIRGDHNAVGELMGEFHERDYRVDGGRGMCFLRYASDPLGFPFMQNVRFTHKQTPLKVYEEASCFRNEQEGEVSGLKRVRNFLMTDMHAACASEAEAKREFEVLCLRFADLMNQVIAPNRWVLGWEGTVDFFEANRDWLIELGVKMRVPAFFKLMPRMSHYYAIKNEYQAIDEDGANVQVSTVQWDVKDGARFDIGYIDEGGRKHPCPVIIHASSFGSIERTLCALLESVAVDAGKGKAPMFPMWLSPTQVRVIPVGREHLDFADDLAQMLSAGNVRADVDDRDDTVGKKIRNGEREWIPYLIVVGDRESGSESLPIRRRGQSDQHDLSAQQLIGEIQSQTAGLPFRPLPLPRRLSQRPIFFG